MSPKEALKQTILKILPEYYPLSMEVFTSYKDNMPKVVDLYLKTLEEMDYPEVDDELMKRVWIDCFCLINAGVKKEKLSFIKHPIDAMAVPSFIEILDEFCNSKNPDYRKIVKYYQNLRKSYLKKHP